VPKLFSPARIGTMVLPNRLVRSATWDPFILHTRQVNREYLDLYRRLALGGSGLIITGGFPVLSESNSGGSALLFEELEVRGLEHLAAAVHETGTGAKVVTQLEVGRCHCSPIRLPSPFLATPRRRISREEIQVLIGCFVRAIIRMQEVGFDGVQLHAAHGGLLSLFLSPRTNHRRDRYGKTLCGRVQIVREIVAGARQAVGSFPILIKVNGTDYLEGGLGLRNFHSLVEELQQAGIDGLEVSGGMMDCLVRSEEELGFRPVPSPEGHIELEDPAKQSYFLPYAKSLHQDVPVILVGGNRDAERLEAFLQQGWVDFVALCRPLIREPDLPRRWREGQGGPGVACVSCNACLYAMREHPGRAEPGPVTCLRDSDPALLPAAMEWREHWVENHQIRPLALNPGKA
jgi:2,4-dienoyl-CoA reductase-like NADH-dependent reductase (Old Yellow Enzyme family)